MAKKIVVKKKDVAEKKAEKTANDSQENVVEKVKKEKKEKAPNYKTERRKFVSDLIIEEKYTDSEIKEMADGKFTELKPLLLSKVNGIRWNINNGKCKYNVPRDGQPYESIVEIDGKKVKRSEKPKKEKGVAAKKKKNDELAEKYGIGKKDGEETNTVKKVKKVKK